MNIDYKEQDNLRSITLTDFLPFPQSITISKALIGEDAGKVFITSGALHTDNPVHVDRQALAMQQAVLIAIDFDYRWAVYTQHPDLLETHP